MDITTWGSDEDKEQAERMLYALYLNYVQKGTPVLLGEFGAINKHNLNDRAAYADYYVRTAKRFGMTCCWWDNGVFDGEEPSGFYGLLNRQEMTWEFPEIAEAMVKAAE